MVDSPPRSDYDYDSDSISEYDEELAIEAKRALAYLMTHRNYRYVEFLAQGGFGWVALVYDDDKARQLAIKCTTETTEMELSWWPRLDHRNILPLLEYITLDTCTVFIMPAMRKDLWTVISERRFYKEELSFGLCRIWLRDVASALAYLHGQLLCHLDLKLDNVFLKENGYACLGDFSLLTDIREVPAGFHFLEVYEPPEYAEWCHGVPPEAIASNTKFRGDKADMWQYGILAVDLFTDLKISGSKSSRLTLFHHDVWPVLEKILLHKEYLSVLLEETFLNVIFDEQDINLFHDFIKNILQLEPDSRMSAENARLHGFTNISWPQLPMEFTVPELVVEHLPEPKPLPREEIADPSLTVQEIMVAEAKSEDADLSRTPSIGALDVMKRKMKKIQKEKIIRRESIAVEAGKWPLEIKEAPSVKGVPKVTSPGSSLEDSPKAETSSQMSQGESREDDSDIEEIKTTTAFIKSPDGTKKPVKVTSIKKRKVTPFKKKNAQVSKKKKSES